MLSSIRAGQSGEDVTFIRIESSIGVALTDEASVAIDRRARGNDGKEGRIYGMLQVGNRRSISRTLRLIRKFGEDREAARDLGHLRGRLRHKWGHKYCP